MNKKTVVVIHENGFEYPSECEMFAPTDMDFDMCVEMIEELGWLYCWPDEIDSYKNSKHLLIQLDDAINPVTGYKLIDDMICEHSSRLHDHQMECLEEGV